MSITGKYNFLILANEDPNDHLAWVSACKEFANSVCYRVVNLTSHNWLEEIQKQRFDVLLAKPGGVTAPYKQLYDERIYILTIILGYSIFPSPLEIFMYENKRLLSYWLKANDIPHPETWVLYDTTEAINLTSNIDYPVVAKTNIGASGSGVVIIRDKTEANNYIKRTFSGKGSPQRTGPNFSKGNIFIRGLHYVSHPLDISKKLKIYKARNKNLQKGFIIFQVYIPHEFEWRVVRIGDSFFAHKKLKSGTKASGTLLKQYDNPPLKLLSFVKKITDKYKFFSQAVDIFESDKGYLVNEMQCIFGQSDPHQMLVNGVPGRYRYLNGNWLFEEGDFARNQCYNIRLDYILNRQL